MTDAGKHGLYTETAEAAHGHRSENGAREGAGAATEPSAGCRGIAYGRAGRIAVEIFA